MLHREHHLIEPIGWLRAVVLGANDGIISTTSLWAAEFSSFRSSGSRSAGIHYSNLPLGPRLRLRIDFRERRVADEILGEGRGFTSLKPRSQLGCRAGIRTMPAMVGMCRG